MPEDTISKVELRRMMNGIKMKKSAYPVELFNQISAVKVLGMKGQAVQLTKMSLSLLS
jgi:hypothetical protein